MLISLIAMGTKMPNWVNEGYMEYAKRLPSDFKLNLVEIITRKRTKESETARLQQQEGDHMLAAIPKQNFVIALDVKGELWDTHQLAHHLQTWHDESQNISLLIGGPEGLAPACLSRANKKWSLSPLTFPHPLVRVVVAEQLYRAWSIITNHPYHRN